MPLVDKNEYPLVSHSPHYSLLLHVTSNYNKRDTQVIATKDRGVSRWTLYTKERTFVDERPGNTGWRRWQNPLIPAKQTWYSEGVRIMSSKSSFSINPCISITVNCDHLYFSFLTLVNSGKINIHYFPASLGHDSRKQKKKF